MGIKVETTIEGLGYRLNSFGLYYVGDYMGSIIRLIRVMKGDTRRLD